MTMHAANRTIPVDATCKVESYGDITVPAGTFKVFKIGCLTTLPTDETYWFSPDTGLFVKSSEKPAANNPFGGAGTRETELVSVTIRK